MWAVPCLYWHTRPLLLPPRSRHRWGLTANVFPPTPLRPRWTPKAFSPALSLPVLRGRASVRAAGPPESGKAARPRHNGRHMPRCCSCRLPALGLSELVQYLIHRPGQLFTMGCFAPGRGCTVGQLAQPQLTGHAGWVAGARQGSALPLGAGCGAGLGFMLLQGCCSDACVRAIPRHRGTAPTGACRAGVRGVPDLCPLLLHHWSEVSCIPASSIKQQAFQQGKFTLRKCREESKTQRAGRCPGSAWVVSHPFWP